MLFALRITLESCPILPDLPVLLSWKISACATYHYVFTHTHTHTQYRLCSRHRRSYPPLHSPYALPFNAALLAGDLHFIPFLREITEIHIKYQAYVPKGGRNSSPSNTNLNIYRHFISFFRISRYIQYKFIFTYISFAFLAKITVTYTTFLFSISLRKQQIAEIPGIYVW